MAPNTAPGGAWSPIWNQYAAAAAQQYGVPLEVVTSVIGAESSWRPNAVSGKGAGGLMQLMPDTFAEVRQQHGLGPDRMDPRTNISAGTAYLGQLHRQFGNWPDAVAAYNAGPSRWRQVLAGKQSAPRETTDYVAKVTAGFGKQGGTMPLFGGASGGISDADLRRMMGRSGGGLLEVDPGKNYAEGLGLLANWGQTESQPPRTEPEPQAGQTERMSVGSRINDIINSLIQPGAAPNRMSRGQMMLGGAAGAMERLAGVHDRRVGLGEMLGALGGGVMRGGAAADAAEGQARAEQFAELGKLGQIQGYQRSEATAVAKVLAARQYAAQLRQSGDPQKIQLAAAIENDPSLMDAVIPKMAEAAFPKVEPYTLAPGARRIDAAGNVIAENPANPHAPRQAQTVQTAEGVFVLNPDGTTGTRIGSPVTAVQKQTPQEREAILESDKAIEAGAATIGTLTKALQLNDKAFSGTTAGARAWADRNLLPGEWGGTVTTEYQNLIESGALTQLKTIFGGNPTEGERKILLDLQASINKSPEERKVILNNAIAAAQARVQREQQRAAALRGGTYYTEGLPPPGGGNANAPDPLGIR